MRVNDWETIFSASVLKISKNGRNGGLKNGRKISKNGQNGGLKNGRKISKNGRNGGLKNARKNG
jgi:hypothetical protein